MNMDRLTELLEAYGADPARWPETERPAAQALLAATPAAREMQREMAALDQMLGQPPTIQPDSGLQARILRQLPPEAGIFGATQRFDVWAALGRLLPLRAAMPQLAVLAVALTLGISAGLGDLEIIFGAEDSASLAVQLVVADSGFLTE